jgi:hypothetical protein
MNSLQLVSRSSTPAVSLTDAKTHLRVDDTYSDTYITALVERATELIEAETNVDLRTTTWNWLGLFLHPRTIDGFSSPYHGHDFLTGWHWNNFRHKIFLPRAPLQSIVSVKYYDVDNTLQTYGSNNYYVMTPHNCLGWIQPALYWPATYDIFRPDASQIQFVSGMTSASALAQQCILLAIGSWYETRENDTEARLSSLGLGFQRLLDQITVQAVIE